MRASISAYEKAVDYLSRRDHSLFELQTKLRNKGYEEDEISEALEKIQERGYLPNPDHLAEKVAEELHRKLKGILYIQEYLKSKNLPDVKADWELELVKAQKLVDKSFEKSSNNREKKEEIFRFLNNRGFAEPTIQKVIHEKR